MLRDRRGGVCLEEEVPDVCPEGVVVVALPEAGDKEDGESRHLQRWFL